MLSDLQTDTPHSFMLVAAAFCLIIAIVLLAAGEVETSGNALSAKVLEVPALR